MRFGRGGAIILIAAASSTWTALPVTGGAGAQSAAVGSTREVDAPALDYESPEAYAIVVHTMVGVLPAQLRDFFDTNRSALTRELTRGDRSNASRRRRRASAESHYIMLDAAARAGESSSARRAGGVATLFPHDVGEASKLFERYGIREGGTLPWALSSRYQALMEAFGSGNGSAVLSTAVDVARFATNAALPFNTTVDRNAADNLRWSVASPAASLWESHTLRHRCHVGLIRRLRSRFEYEVRVSRSRFRRLDDPIEEIFGVLQRAHDSIDALQTIDARIVALLGVTDGASFQRVSIDYYRRLTEEAAPILETRLEDAALLAANLVGTAWQQAGRALPAGGSAKRSASGVGVTRGSFLGSRHSTVFHRRECPHARRIKAINRIVFKTLQEALKSGRTGCRRCRPGGG